MDFCVFVEAHVVLIVSLSAVLQVVGTLLLYLFSLFGIEITASPNVFVNDKPVTYVTFNQRWLIAAKAGVLLLLAGLVLSGVAGIVSAASVAGLSPPAAHR